MKKYLICLLTITACHHTPKAYEGSQIRKNDFINFANQNGIKPAEFDKILIIPGVGCGGCITDAQRYFNENYSNTRTLYVFTGIIDLKVVKNMIPESAKANKNLIIDSTNYIMNHGYKTIYPSEVKINDHEDLLEISKI